MAPSRKDKQELNQLIQALEREDFSGTSTEYIQQRVDAVYQALTKAGFAAGGEYNQRIDRVVDKLNGLTTATPLPNPPSKTDYVGMSGQSLIRVISVFEHHLFVSRNYHEQMKLSWRFNKEGRIDLIDAMLFPSNKIVNLARTKNFERLPSDWTQGIVECNLLPPQINLVNRDFHILDAKHWELIRYGHINVKNLVSDLRRGDIRDCFNPRGNQKQLKEILNDSAAMCLVRKADTMPELVEYEEKVLKIKYP